MSEENISFREIEAEIRAGYKQVPAGRYKRVFQILEMISFGDYSSFEVFHSPNFILPSGVIDEIDPHPLDERIPEKIVAPPTRYFAGIVRWHYAERHFPPHIKYRETYSAYLEDEVIESLLQRFNNLQVPFWIDVNVNGKDGTMYEMQFGDNDMYQLNIKWWEDYPLEWKPFFDIVEDTIAYIEKMANAPKKKLPGPFGP